MRQVFNVTRDSSGNRPPLPAIFPDQMAPAIRNHDRKRDLIPLRWGFPPPPKVGNHLVPNGTKADPVEGEFLLYSFLTSEPNGVVGLIHPKAMPVILMTPEKFDAWLNGPAEEALKFQRPLPDEMLRIVAEGNKSDQPLS
jgi:putative SOS response-associated peptidase YedK